MKVYAAAVLDPKDGQWKLVGRSRECYDWYETYVELTAAAMQERCDDWNWGTAKYVVLPLEVEDDFLDYKGVDYV